MRCLAGILIISLFCVRAISSPLPQQPDKRTEELQRERERLKREKDPVGHTKIQVAISEILLSFVGDAVKNGDLAEMQKQLDEYRASIHDAFDTIMSTGRDANRHPSGFKDLELALRRQINRIKDYSDVLTFEQREPLAKVKTEASEMRDHLIQSLLLEDKNGKTAHP